MTRKLITVVTGSNRGIGQGIINVLASTKHPKPLIIYATSRAGKNEGNAQAQHDNEIRYEKLDVSDKQSILQFLRMAVKQDPGSRAVDILINNAGVNMNPDEGPDEAERTIDVNYRSLKTMCEMFLDVGNMKSNPGARIVNVSSTGSDLSNYSKPIAQRFRGAQTVQDVDALADEYLQAKSGGGQANAGFGKDNHSAVSYQVSKACVNAYTQVLAREHRNLLVNCCCPGWVATDMGNLLGRPPKSLEDGAKIPVRLAVGDIADESGKYWGNKDVFGTGDGEIRPW